MKSANGTIEFVATMFPTLSKSAVRREIPASRRRRKSSPALGGMMLALALLAREPLMICLRRMFLRPRRSAAENAARLLSVPSLRAAILGHGKQYITDMFGPPPTASAGECPIWYYPLSSSDRVAMAISFHHERAAIVEFFQSP